MMKKTMPEPTMAQGVAQAWTEADKKTPVMPADSPAKKKSTPKPVLGKTPK